MTDGSHSIGTAHASTGDGRFAIDSGTSNYPSNIEQMFETFIQTPQGDFKPSFYNPFEVKHRRRTTKDQFLVLERTFLENAKPSATDRRLIAESLRMSLRAVQVWFQNRRAKSKNSKGEPSKGAKRADGEGASRTAEGGGHPAEVVLSSGSSSYQTRRADCLDDSTKGWMGASAGSPCDSVPARSSTAEKGGSRRKRSSSRAAPRGAASIHGDVMAPSKEAMPAALPFKELQDAIFGAGHEGMGAFTSCNAMPLNAFGSLSYGSASQQRSRSQLSALPGSGAFGPAIGQPSQQRPHILAASGGLVERRPSLCQPPPRTSCNGGGAQIQPVLASAPPAVQRKNSGCSVNFLTSFQDLGVNGGALCIDQLGNLAAAGGAQKTPAAARGANFSFSPKHGFFDYGYEVDADAMPSNAMQSSESLQQDGQAVGFRALDPFTVGLASEAQTGASAAADLASREERGGNRDEALHHHNHSHNHREGGAWDEEGSGAGSEGQRGVQEAYAPYPSPDGAVCEFLGGGAGVATGDGRARVRQMSVSAMYDPMISGDGHGGVPSKAKGGGALLSPSSSNYRYSGGGVHSSGSSADHGQSFQSAPSISAPTSSPTDDHHDRQQSYFDYLPFGTHITIGMLKGGYSAAPPPMVRADEIASRPSNAMPPPADLDALLYSMPPNGALNKKDYSAPLCDYFGNAGDLASLLFPTVGDGDGASAGLLSTNGCHGGHSTGPLDILTYLSGSHTTPYAFTNGYDDTDACSF